MSIVYSTPANLMCVKWLWDRRGTPTRVQLSPACTQARPRPGLLLHPICKTRSEGSSWTSKGLIWASFAQTYHPQLCICWRGPSEESSRGSTSLCYNNRKWELIPLLHTLPALTSCCTFKYVNLVWFTQVMSSCGCLVDLSLLLTFIKLVCLK